MQAQPSDIAFRSSVKPFSCRCCSGLKTKQANSLNLGMSHSYDSIHTSNAIPDSRRANAGCERFLGSVRRECLDYFLIFYEKQLSRLLMSYVRYFNQARPHQGLGQRIPDPPVHAAPSLNQPNQVIVEPMVDGLHHDTKEQHKAWKSYSPRGSGGYLT